MKVYKKMGKIYKKMQLAIYTTVSLFLTGFY
jgi:hypothetical protein